MGNYKNLRFTNSMDGFKSWGRNFPPMDKDAVKAQGFKREGDYYLELQLVEGFLSSSKFVSASVRKYDQESANFEYVGVDKEKELLETVFKNKVESFKTRHNAPFFK